MQRLYERTAERGRATAMNYLGAMYHHGAGVAKDCGQCTDAWIVPQPVFREEAFLTEGSDTRVAPTS